jgi:anaerobic magnesium-protoporphyrin IX monomethyl ester cyclase
MLNIVLAMPKMEAYKDYHYFPLGILAIAASIDNIKLINYDIYDERVDDPARLDALLKKADIVCVSMFTGYQVKCGYDILTKVKKFNKNITTIVGGPHATALPDETIKSDMVDYVVAGYAENSFRELIVDILNYGKLARAISGVCSKEANYDVPSDIKITYTETPKSYKDLEWNAIPYHKIDISKYINPATQRVIYVTQYGCPAKCTFCATPETRKWAEKPMELIKKDLTHLYETTKFKQLVFFDATLFTRKSRVKEIVEFVSSEFGDTSWIADARAIELKNYTVEDLLEINKSNLKLHHLTVGLESGSKRIVEDIYKKGKGHNHIYLETAEKLFQANIELTSGCIFGAPTETAADLYETLDYVTEVKKRHPRFKLSTTFFRPLPGTDLYEFVKDYGIDFPNTLDGWAKLEGVTHYEYNKWASVPWMDSKEEKKYLVAYNEFLDAHGDILV